MKILIACEESQRVCDAFRRKGHEAYSCDILPTSGIHPEWHIQGDVLPLLKEKWDMIIAFPPCTYLSKAGARWLYHDGKIDEERLKKGLAAKEFFMKFYNAECEKIAIENPRDMAIFGLPQFSQEIQPYFFGEPYSKATRLWLKGLPLLKPTSIITNFRTFMPSNTGGGKRGQHHLAGIPRSQVEASKTFQGVAEAMADQWGF